ncbi:MAG: SMP-30/gluconolactonase/LRE family protein [Chitinophagaceae bacterium]|nr:MAG: SMP-30/gluconolactonase/LRE family protein [Chitinophagaceae bacterium]
MFTLYYLRHSISLICGLMATATAIAQPWTGTIRANGESPVGLSSRFSFTEGPAVDKKGNVYFTDQPNNKIWKYSTDSMLTVFLHNAGRSNGMYFDKKGNLVTCADENNQLWSIAPDTSVKLILKDFNGIRFNGPNDLWITKKGGIYFTDPYYKRDYWTNTKTTPTAQGVYFLAKNKRPVLVAGDLQKANGIVGTSDNKFLYVADIEADTTFKYSIKKDGTLGKKMFFAAKGSDGMTLDNKGNLYLTGKGVTVFNSAGVLIEHIDIPEPWTANVCFGGKNRDVLFITAGKSVYSLRTKVRGVQ